MSSRWLNMSSRSTTSWVRTLESQWRPLPSYCQGAGSIVRLFVHEHTGYQCYVMALHPPTQLAKPKSSHLWTSTTMSHPSRPPSSQHSNPLDCNVCSISKDLKKKTIIKACWRLLLWKKYVACLEHEETWLSKLLAGNKSITEKCRCACVWPLTCTVEAHSSFTTRLMHVALREALSCLLVR